MDKKKITCHSSPILEKELKKIKIEWKKLRELIKNVKTSKIQKKFYKSWGEVAIIDQSKNFIAGYTDNIKCITKESIVFGDHTCSIKFINFPFVQGADGIKILQTKDNLVSLKYIYYSMCNFIKYDGKYRRHWSDISNIPIPIPSLKEQERIVKILDKFSEITAELTASIKQYEYYRNYLLKFSSNANFKKLGDFLHYIQPTKYIVNSTNYSNDFNTPVLTAGKSFILGYTNEDSNIYIASKQKPIIIFDDFTSSFKWVDFPFKIKSSAAKIIIPRNIDVNIRFFYYLMSNLKYTPSSHSRQWIAKYSKIIVPVPSIKEQERILKILDKFELLTQNLEKGLPKEIELINKQYEYYRNKSLSFEGSK